MKYFAENGYSVLIPMGDYQKYDLVVEKEDQFFRIQCKVTRSQTVHLTSSGHYGGKYLDLAKHVTLGQGQVPSIRPFFFCTF